MAVSPIRVVIADDHPIIRAGVRTVLEQSEQVVIVGTATNFDEVMDVLATTVMQVLILDLSGMGGTPFTLVTRIRRDYPTVGIVIFSSLVDMAPELIATGVRGYVVKEEMLQELLRAVRAIARGATYFSPIVANYLDQISDIPAQRRLQPNELTVLKLMALGLSTTAIAAQMGINPRTVQNYISLLRRKTGCAQRVQLVDWYRRTYEGATGDVR
ncbi:MAG TPA: response regulator transcription factor [Roseiflexaceae bacterium]|nr:response regulator transcription factor [Roseiflexaceae bacterium]HMP42533.1 response regulator transcription factor [Roseiflexaceae bacterium]